MSEQIQGSESFTTSGGNPSRSGGFEASESSAKEKAQEAFEQGKERAKELGAHAQEKVISKADQLRSENAQRLHRFAEAMEHLSGGDGQEELAPMARFAARYVRRAGDLLDEKSADELIAKVRSEVRDRPGLVLLGMAAVGFLGARLLKE
jgi:hypothetical protein